MNDFVEIYGVLCDFFERHLGAAAADDPNWHTSDEARTLTNALLKRLSDEGISIALTGRSPTRNRERN